MSRQRNALYIAAGLVAITALWLALVSMRSNHDGGSARTQPRESEDPSLNCAFHSYTNSELVAGFDFSASFPGGQPMFEERARGSIGKEKITFDVGERPLWTFGYEDEIPNITSPDQTTRIILYGLKLGAPGTHFIEAGVRSNEFRNLGGICRQVNFSLGSQSPS